MQPGPSVSAIARRIGVDPSQSFTWRRNARL
ncbi:transposase [Rhizobium etli]